MWSTVAICCDEVHSSALLVLCRGTSSTHDRRMFAIYDVSPIPRVQVLAIAQSMIRLPKLAETSPTSQEVCMIGLKWLIQTDHRHC